MLYSNTKRRKREKEAQQHLLDMQEAAADSEINLDRKVFLVEKEKKGFFDRRRGRHDSNFQTVADEKGSELFRQEQYNKQTKFDRRTHSSARSSPSRNHQYHSTLIEKRTSEDLNSNSPGTTEELTLRRSYPIPTMSVTHNEKVHLNCIEKESFNE